MGDDVGSGGEEDELEEESEEDDWVGGVGGEGEEWEEDDWIGGVIGKGVASLGPNDSHEHSHHNSWGIEDDEDGNLRDEFPTVEGHLFEVDLNKGKGGLGLSFVGSTTSPTLQGIVIVGVQSRSVAAGRIRWGDMILKVNDTVVIGMTQQQVQELLARAPPIVHFVLLR